MAVTWNPSDKHANIALTGSNLTATQATTSGRYAVRATLGRTTGKWYFEVYVTGSHANAGVMYKFSTLSVQVGDDGNDAGFYLDASSYHRVHNSSTTASDSGSYSAPFTIMVAVDLDANKIWFGYDGTWAESGDPAAGTNPSYSSAWGSGNEMFPAFSGSTTTASASGVGRFSGGFSYSVPSGFLPWENEIVLVGQTLTAQQGSFILDVSVAVGNAGTTPLAAPLITSAWQTTMADPTAPWTHHNNFVSLQAQLRGVGEFVQSSGSGHFGRARIDYALDQDERLTGLLWSSTATESWEYSNHGDGESSTYQHEGGGSYYLQFSPQAYQFNNDTGNSSGGHFSIGRDGSVHWVYARSYSTTSTYYLTYRNSVTNRVTNVEPIQSSTETLVPCGVYAHDVNNALVFYPSVSGGNAPLTYKQWDGDSWGSAVQLTGWTGSTVCQAQANYLVVTRAGYGDTIYVTYSAIGDSANRYIGLVVLDAVTLSVTSHVLTQIPTAIAYFSNEQSAWPVHDTTVPHRPLAEVAVLSGGTSVTQFLLHYSVAHLSWTSGTATSPTLTLKSRPTPADGVVPGWEELYVRGDTVQHILYGIDFTETPSGSNYNYTDKYYGYRNDATGTGSTWTVTDKVVEFDYTLNGTERASYVSAFLSGFGGGKHSYLYTRPLNAGNNPSINKYSGRAWVDWWGGLSVSTEAVVGSVTISITDELAVPLIGQAATVSQGVLVPATSLILAGQGLTTQQGIVGVTLYDVFLNGHTMTLASGVLYPTPGVELASSQLSLQSGIIIPMPHVRLDGQQMGASGGLLGTAATFTPAGFQVQAQAGSLGTGVDMPLLGQAVVGVTGAFVPAVSMRLAGNAAVVRGGVFVPLNSPLLAGLQMAVLDGVLQTAFTVPLSGVQIVSMNGTLGFLYDCNLYPSGIPILCEAGVFPAMTNVPTTKADRLLWIVKEPRL